MSRPAHRAARTPGATALAFGVIAAALAVVAVLAVILAGRGRDDFDRGSVRQLTGALRAQGLMVCASNGPDAGHDSGGSISTQVLHVGLPPRCGDAIDVQVDAYHDRRHRDAAARNAEAQERQRNYGVVYTWHRYTVYLQGDDASGSTPVRNRVVAALDSVGAR